ncbi:hypothetical protein [Arthrobacter sp. 147(2020)]|nr:hypothetical protein [Arthrobacter sp. 147(2020)]
MIDALPTPAEIPTTAARIAGKHRLDLRQDRRWCVSRSSTAGA